jgi:hypothetical protein
MENLSLATTAVSGVGTSINDANSGHGVIYSFFDGFLQIGFEIGGGIGGAAACVAGSPFLQAACGVAGGYGAGQFEKSTFKSWFG